MVIVNYHLSPALLTCSRHICRGCDYNGNLQCKSLPSNYYLEARLESEIPPCMQIPLYKPMSSKFASVAPCHNSSLCPTSSNLSSLRATLVRALLYANGKIKEYEKALEQNNSSDWFEWKDLNELRKKQEKLAKQYATQVKDEQQDAEDQNHLQEVQRHGKLRVNRRQQNRDAIQWYAGRTAQAEREYHTMMWRRHLKEVQLRKEAGAVRARREEAARIRAHHEAEAEHNRRVAQRRVRHEQYLLSKAKHEAHARELNRLRAQKEAEEKQKQWKLRQILLQNVSTRLAVRHRRPIKAQEANQHLKDLSLKILQEFQKKIVAECEDRYKEIRIRSQRKIGKPFPALNFTDSQASIQSWRCQNLNQENVIQNCK